jgi:2',3'-cyclic-nucleotide 2'-phosphodiesterase (5'-nucleotidase family)
LARRATYIESVFEEGASVLMLDGGDLCGQRNQNEKHQTEFLSGVTADFGTDAIGLGERDLNYGRPFLEKLMKDVGLPFTNANVRVKETGELLCPEYLVVERGGVRFGIVSVLDPGFRIMSMTAQEEEYDVADPVATLRELLPRVREVADTIVLLGHLGDARTEQVLREVNGIDVAVVGHSHRNVDTERLIGDTILLCSAFEGRYIGRANMFFRETDGRVMAVDVMTTSLDDKIEDDAEMAQRVTDYKDSLVAFKEAKRAEFPRNLGSRSENFLGDRACKSCHEDSWKAYADSKHRQAYMTLRRKGQFTEPACLSCHTTGYQHQNGYADESPYNRLVNVQCEACHGYGTEHARDGSWITQAKESCVTCHDAENSPDFDYATYWEKIKH